MNYPAGRFCDELRDWRTRQGVSQREAARRLGVTPAWVEAIELNLLYPGRRVIANYRRLMAVYDAEIQLRLNL